MSAGTLFFLYPLDAQTSARNVAQAWSAASESSLLAVATDDGAVSIYTDEVPFPTLFCPPSRPFLGERFEMQVHYFFAILM